MARYALRNQQKIKEVYGTSVLERMKVSLDAYFKADDKVLVRNEERSKWQPAFFVRDLGEEVIFRFKVLPIQSGRVATVSHCIPFEGNENIAFTDYGENLSF